MRAALFPLVVALGAVAAPLSAQTCVGPAAPRTFVSQDPFTAHYFFGSVPGIPAKCNLLFDLDVQVPIAVTALRGTCCDQGAPGAQLPNQVGATAPALFDQEFLLQALC